MNHSIFYPVTTQASFLAAVGPKDEIKTGHSDHGFQTTSYVVSMPTTFDSPAARECRGIVFNSRGCVSRPLHKFFNLNERDGARPEDFDWSKLMRVMDKRDGSMIHTVNVGPHHSPFTGYGFDVKSKKSFTSDVANSARALLQSLPNYLEFCDELAALDKTAIFEFTSPTARIVLPYTKDELVLLHIRDNDSGAYASPGELEFLAQLHKIPVVANNTAIGTDELFAQMLEGDRDPKQIWHAVQKLAETVEGIEGWIFQFENGEMVKVKTKWYIERHHAMTNLRERDLHLECIRETVDDLKAMLVQEGVDISEIEAIETKVATVLTGLLREVTAVLAIDKSMERKDFALKHGPTGLNQTYMGFPFFSLLMKAYEGKEPDIKHWYERNVLPTVSLRQLNLVQSVAEAE